MGEVFVLASSAEIVEALTLLFGEDLSLAFPLDFEEDEAGVDFEEEEADEGATSIPSWFTGSYVGALDIAPELGSEFNGTGRLTAPGRS